MKHHLLLLFFFFLSKVVWGAPDYLKEVKPLFASRCFDCHGALKQEAKLRVDTAQAMIDMEMIIPGEPDDSELIYRITTD